MFNLFGTMLALLAPGDPPPGDPPPGDPPPGDPPPGFQFPENWKEGIAPEYRDHPSIAPITDPNSLVKSFIHAQKLVGADKIAIPGKNATPDERDEFYKKLGRPDTADAYDLPKPKDEQTYDYESEKLLRGAMHGLGLSNAQAVGLVNFLNEQADTQIQAIIEAEEQAIEGARGALKKEWGAAYDKNMAIAQRVIKDFADKDAFEALQGDLGNNPAVLNMLVEIGKKTLEADFIDSGGDTDIAPAQAKAQIQEIQNDKNHPYHNKSMPGHTEAVHKVNELYKLAYPET